MASVLPSQVTPGGAGSAIAHLRDGTPVGAWMLKANPAVWDIGAALVSGTELDWWRLAHSYRADLVRRGHPVVMWVTRGDPRVASGVWAIGEVAGDVVLGAGDDQDPLWRSEIAREQVRPRIAVRLEVLEEPLTREEFAAHPDLEDAEILRVPRAGNPVALTPDEWGALEHLIDDGRADGDG